MKREALRSPLAIFLFVLVAKAGILLLAGTRYGFMSDELYFLDAAARPALGYLDFPPLLPWLMALLGWFELNALFVLRALAAALW